MDGFNRKLHITEDRIDLGFFTNNMEQGRNIHYGNSTIISEGIWQEGELKIPQNITSFKN
jgi:hypothetical protein